MNQKIKLLLALTALVVVIGGASLLYPQLAKQYVMPMGFAPAQATPTPTIAPTELPATETSTSVPTSTPVPDVTPTLTPDVTAAPTDTPRPTDPPQPTDEAPEAEIFMAPDFEVLDANGQPVHLSDFVGKPVVMNFWATWCPPCKSELPTFDRLAAECGDDIVFLMIDLTDGSRDTIDGVKAFVEENGYTFPVYYDTKYSAATAYGANSIPMTILVDPQGVLAGYAVGALSEGSLRRGITELLGISLE